MLVNVAVLAAIYKSFSTIFNESLAATKPNWEKVAMRAPSGSSLQEYGWLKDLPQLREWLGDRVIKALEAEGYQIRNKAFEVTIGVLRDHIEDDQLGIFTPRIQEMAVNGAMHPDKLVFDLLKAGFDTDCYDDQFFFDDDHPMAGSTVSNDGGGGGNPWFLLDMTRPIKPLIYQHRRDLEFVAITEPKAENVFMRREYLYGVDYRGNAGYGLWQLAYGSKDTLDATNYEAARVAMRTLTNDEGEPLEITPNLLVCGPSNEGAALELLLSERTAAGATNKWRNTAELLVVQRVETT